MHKPAKEPNDLENFFVERANAGDIEGLVALYEPNAIVAYGDGRIVTGLNQIREFLVKFLANRPQLDPSIQVAALCSGDLALTSSRLSNGDITAKSPGVSQMVVGFGQWINLHSETRWRVTANR